MASKETVKRMREEQEARRAMLKSGELQPRPYMPLGAGLAWRGLTSKAGRKRGVRAARLAWLMGAMNDPEQAKMWGAYRARAIRLAKSLRGVH